MSDDNKISLHAFTELVAKRAKVSRIEADAYVHQFVKSLSKELEEGGDISLYHFGRFHTTHVNEQPGHDPNSGAPLMIPAHSRVHFHAYDALRFSVNAPFRHLRIRELTPDKTAWRTRTGAWILLLLLLLLLLIVLGVMVKRWISTQDAPVVVPVVLSDKSIVAQIDPTSVSSTPVIDVTTPLEPEISPTDATAVTVSPGDTLWGIAETQLGSHKWWPVIYAENRLELTRHNPDYIPSGMALRIPALVGDVSSPEASDIRLKTKAYRVVAGDYRKRGNARAAAYKKAAARMSKK